MLKTKIEGVHSSPMRSSHLTRGICMRPSWFSPGTQANNHVERQLLTSATRTIDSCTFSSPVVTILIRQASDVAVMSSRTLRQWVLRATKHGSRPCVLATAGQPNSRFSLLSASNLSLTSRYGAPHHQTRKSNISLLIVTSNQND